MRCPSCEKMVAFDEPVTDELTVEIDEATGELTLSGSFVRPCADCGEHLAGLEIEADCDAADQFSADNGPDEAAGETAEYTLDSWELGATDRKAGGPRGKRLLGVEATCQVTRSILDRDGNVIDGRSEQMEVKFGQEEPASSFEPLA